MTDKGPFGLGIIPAIQKWLEDLGKGPSQPRKPIENPILTTLKELAGGFTGNK